MHEVTSPAPLFPCPSLHPPPFPPQARSRRTILRPVAAMFDNLSSSLTNAFKSIAPDGRLTPENIKGPLRDVRRALLEADVSLPVVRRFVAAVEAKALGMEVGGGREQGGPAGRKEGGG